MNEPMITESAGMEQDEPRSAAPVQSASGVARRKRPGLRVLAVGALAAAVLIGALALGALSRWRQAQKVNAEAAQAAAASPRVTVAIAHRLPTDAERVLPGNALPLLETALYARTTGYLKRRLVDIGDHVTKGQLLAEINAPDVDDQLAQAEANLEQARANLKLSQANSELAKTVLARTLHVNAESPGVVTQQEIDQERAKVATTLATVDASQATIVSNQAAVNRYADLQEFQKITAPFPGVITARNVDPGDLLSADSPSTTKEMFHLMRTDVLRVLVNVPQIFATGIKVDQDAVVYRREEPRKQYPGKVTRTADALDPNTRTLLTEVQVPNEDGALRPGMYLQVKFVFDRDVLPVVIPPAALAMRAGGPRVATLDDQHRVHYRTVDLGRDFGAEIAVLNGLEEGETIVVYPGDDLPEGTVVTPVLPSK